MSQPLVTILLPVYNGEKTIKATLESLLNQTFSNFELLIGIDGTNDNSRAIAESFNDARIIIIEHPKNLGLANNLNAIIKEASAQSEFFAMAEQDDVYVLKRLEWQIEVMQNQPDIGLVSGIAEFKGDSESYFFPGLLVYNKTFPKGLAMFKYLYINQLKVVNTCMLWRKSVHVKSHLIFKNTYGNFNVDWSFILRFSLVSQIYGIPKKLVVMNRGLANTSITTDKQGQFDASEKLIKDFKIEFGHLISNKDYRDALKVQRKIRLGYNTKIMIIFKSVFYFILYRDFYFLRYIVFVFKKTIKNKFNSV